MKRGREEEKGRVFLVSIKQLNRLGLSSPKLWTVYSVHSAVVLLLCEITSALKTCKITVMFNKILNMIIITKFACSIYLYNLCTNFEWTKVRGYGSENG